LASAHRLGAEQLLPVALKALKKSEAQWETVEKSMGNIWET
jgi:hypothetical protein